MSDRSRDGGVCTLLFAGTIIYLYYWPRELYGYDDGVFLYEAKRILDGQTIYRDFFDIVAPGAFYLMAGFYAVFGVTLSTALGAMAVAHGLIGVLVFIICRRLGVRIGLALAAALLHLTLAYPASSIASVHWVSTVLSLGLLLGVLYRPATTDARAAMWGALNGLLLVTHHQKGLPLAAAVGAVLMLDSAGSPRFFRALLRRGASYLGGVLLIVAPVVIALMVTAGTDNVLNALVWHPLLNYPRTAHSKGAFGEYLPLVHPFGFIIKWLPSVLPAAAMVMIWQWRSAPPQRAWLVTTILGVGTLLSIAYNPNYVHLAFMAPMWISLAALLLESLAATMECAGTPGRVAGRVLLVMVIVGSCWRMGDNLLARRRAYPVSTETAFGWINVMSKEHAGLIGWFADLFRAERAAEVFCYPTFPGFYLITGVENATRYQIVVPDYTERAQLEEIVATLESRRVPFVIRTLYPGAGTLEPLHSYVQDHYVPVKLPIGAAMALFRRRPSRDAGADVF